MNPITPENIHMHELIGLSLKIIESSDKNLIGINGQVVDETKNMLKIYNDEKKQQMMIPKKDCVFQFKLPSGESVDIDGKILRLKPENRLKNIIHKRW